MIFSLILHVLKVIDAYYILLEHPEILDGLTKKDPGLDKRLEGLVVNPEKFGEVSVFF